MLTEQEEFKQSTDALFAEQDALQKEMKELKIKYKEKAKQVFKDLSKAVFKLVPGIKSIAWNQYVPGFNDGDPCTFTQGELFFSNATATEINEHGGFNEDTFYHYKSEGHETLFFSSPMWPESYKDVEKLDINGAKWVQVVSEEQNEVLRRFDKFVSTNQGLMEDLFGSDVQIVITKDGAEAEHYDCGY